MQRLPNLTFVRINEGPSIFGSYVDETWVLHLIIGGQWTFQMEGRNYPVQTGDIILLPPRLLHIVRQTGGCEHAQYVLHFQVSGWFPGDSMPLVISPPREEHKAIIRYFKSIHREWTQSKPFENMITGGLLAQLLGLYLRYAQIHTIPATEQVLAWKSIEETIAYFQENLQRPGVKLADVSQAVHLTPNYLCRVFKQNTGYTPIKYLGLLRLSKAESLLLSTTLNCTQIAEAVGYDDLHTFSRAFRNVHGISPSGFRREHTRNENTSSLTKK